MIARVAAGPSSEDRATVLQTEDGLVVALADGAGGLGHGARAAQAWIDSVIDSPIRERAIGPARTPDAKSGVLQLVPTGTVALASHGLCHLLGYIATMPRRRR